MRYYEKRDESGKVICFGIGPGGVEITEEEYDALMDRFHQVQAAANAVYAGDVSIGDVDEDIRADVQAYVETMRAAASGAEMN